MSLTPLPLNRVRNPVLPDLPSSFEQLHAEYRPRVHSYLQRFAGSAEAEDLTQEVFLKVHQKLSSFRGECRVSTWIFQIATHTALDRLKSPSRRLLDQKSLRIEKLEELGQPAVSDHGRVPLHDEMCRCIQGFIEDLPRSTARSSSSPT